ncbi:MAG TPA: glycerophosphodiester phosphodiesterase family protein [Elusimicrobiota bacterium]|nr:glycerophosphodiester phosphodiesterase family protein [Elusimicrobiota bacterium]
MLSLWPRQASSLIIGHRGAMGYAPENTLASFEEAIRRGVDAIELDVQLTADGQVAVMHDTSVDRTTNGEGMVRDLPLKKIQSFDAGAWYGPDYAKQYVPSLTDVISRFRNRRTVRHQALGWVIELKTVRGAGGSLADAVVALLQREEFMDRVFIISFDPVALQVVRSAHKSVPLGLLYSEEGDESRIAQARWISAQAVFPRKTCVTARGVMAAHKAGLAVAAWTANTKNEMKRMLACGVDSICTNYPDRLRSLME